MLKYIGNGHYCYANSAAMLLASIGEEYPPSLIEVLSGTGLGATYKKSTKFLYFNNQTLYPDLGISKVIDMLGFTSKVHVNTNPSNPPWKELEEDLEQSPAILGPLDMKHLVYNPDHQHLAGADHYILAYKIENNKVFLHDPASFPYVSITKENLRKSWAAKGSIAYAEGNYRYITNPKRMGEPKETEIYEEALKHFVEIYKTGEKRTDKEEYKIGEEAILKLAHDLAKSPPPEGQSAFFKYFLFQLGARRANDFALFFAKRNPELANLKEEQAKLHGICHTCAAEENWSALAAYLKDIARSEKEFRAKLLS